VRAGPTLAVALGVAAFGTVVATPLVGVVAGAATALALVRPRWRGLLGILAVAAVVLTGLFVAVQQSRRDFKSVIEWPTFFDRVHALALGAVVLLVADVAVRAVLRRGTGPPPHGVAPAQNGPDATRSEEAG
jgi:hypothetical protein